MLDYGEPELAANRDYDLSKSWGGEVRLALPIGRYASLTSGVEYIDAYSLLLDNYDITPDYVDYANAKGSRSACSLYTQAETMLGARLRLIAGARLDDYSSYGRNWSPRAALVYKPDSSNTIKLLRGEAFRAPNFYETDYYDSYSTVANHNLRPETITTSEIVWEKESAHTRLTASLFRFDLDQVITQTTLPDEMQQFQNQGSVRSQGFEFQAERRSSAGFTGYLGFTLLRATEVETDEPVSNSPRFQANAGLYIPLRSLSVALCPSLQWIGSRRSVSGGAIPRSATANLEITRLSTVRWAEFRSGHIQHLQQPIVQPGGNEHTQDKIPQEARTVQLVSSYAF